MSVSKRESILVALHAALAAADAMVTRNAMLTDIVDADRFATLLDGGLAEVEAFINGSVYEFTATPRLIFGVRRPASGDLDGELAVREAIYVAALEDLGDLGGLVTDIRPQPVEYDPRELFGSEDSKAAALTIEIDYWSAHSVG